MRLALLATTERPRRLGPHRGEAVAEEAEQVFRPGGLVVEVAMVEVTVRVVAVAARREMAAIAAPEATARRVS